MVQLEHLIWSVAQCLFILFPGSVDPNLEQMCHLKRHGTAIRKMAALTLGPTHAMDFTHGMRNPGFRVQRKENVHNLSVIRAPGFST